MKRIALTVLLLLVSLAIFAHAQTGYIIRPTSTSSVATIAKRHGLAVVRPLNVASSVYLVTAPSAIPPSQVESEVGGDSEVTDFELDQTTSVPEVTRQSTGVILDQLLPPAGLTYAGTRVLRDYLTQISPRILKLWSTQKTYHVTGKGIVAIIDTGVDPLHRVLAPSLMPGYDFVHNAAGPASDWSELNTSTRNILLKSNPDPASKSYMAVLDQSTGVILDQSTGVILDGGSIPQEFGHGTMVAGIIHLVAPTATIMPLKAFSADGSAQLSNIIRAIYYAADHKANVINMSFTVSQPSAELADAIDYAQGSGVICFAAAGNTGTAQVGSPANLTEVMGIASTTPNDTVSHFTNYGNGVFLAAPGENVVTTYPGNNYAEVSGTSFSTPFAAATAALLYQMDPSVDYSGASSTMSHAVHVSQLVGKGRLDIYQTIHAESVALQNQP
jgi:hypothetical protein